jgi:hypothetical protein
MKRVICKVRGHRPDRRNMRPAGGYWRGTCQQCSCEIVRVAPRRWLCLSDHIQDGQASVNRA